MRKYPIVVKKIFDTETWQYHMKIIKGERKTVKYPMVPKIMSDEEKREYHLKRIERLCLQSIKEDRFYQKKGYYFTPDWEHQQMINKRLGWGKRF